MNKFVSCKTEINTKLTIENEQTNSLCN